MINFYDIAYSAGLAVSAPYWLIKNSARRKVFSALRERMGQVAQRAGDRPAVMIHAVSLGEMNATRGLVSALKSARPELEIIISSTTETGFARANELYGGDPSVRVIRYPLDFTSAVSRVLDGLRPSAVVLMELEAWPNFVFQCEKRRIPVIVVNGRMTDVSFRRYRTMRPLLGGMFRRLSAVCVQDEVNVRRFIEAGAARDRVSVTGTMKFDTAAVANRVDGDHELASALGIDQNELVWVCGSTGPGEEKILLDLFRELRKRLPDLRLCIIPRHPQRFEEVAGLIQHEGFTLVRRSETGKAIPKSSAADRPIILGDTMGELRKFYSLAGVVFVGRTLVDLGSRQHGSDMIEPAALGKAVIVGPYTGNFADAMAKFREAGAIVEVREERELRTAVESLLSDPARAGQLGEKAKQVVMEQKGATARHVEVVLKFLK